MKRRARFSAERVANAQVRQLEDEARMQAAHDAQHARSIEAAGPDEYFTCEVYWHRTTPAERIRLLYGLRV